MRAFLIALIVAVLLLPHDALAQRRGGGGGRSFGGGGGRSISSGGRSFSGSHSFSGGAGRSLSGSRLSQPGGSGISFSRPSAARPSFSLPSAAARPSIGGATRPSGGGSRLPSVASGTRPSLGPGGVAGGVPGTRPGGGGISLGGSGISLGGGSGISVRPRPELGLGSRPSIGSLPGGGTRPEIATRPEIGTRPGGGLDLGSGQGLISSTRPGIGQLPSFGQRPGNVGRPGSSTGRLPGLAAGVGIGAGVGAIATRPGTGGGPGISTLPARRPVADRRDQLQQRLDRYPGYGLTGDRMVNRGDRLEYRGDRIQDRGDRWHDRRDNWHDWHDSYYHHHHDWYHGHWHGFYGGGARWNYWWDNYPVFTAFGITTWAIHRTSWAFGYCSYVNPYYYAPGTSTVIVDNSVYDYSQPIVMMPSETTLAADPAAPPPAESAALSPGLALFQQAQQQFYQGDYPAALSSADAALKELPNDTVIHEFRALVLFALGRYQDAAATLHAVLSVGPGWDWTTLSSLYADVETYTKHLRALEHLTKSEPRNAAALFVLAYHYISCGHDDAAARQLKRLVALVPDDQLAADLLQQADPSAEVPTPANVVKPPQPDKAPTASALVGSWQAQRTSGDAFAMTLNADGTFSWTYTPKSGKPTAITGTYAVDQQGVIAMEMNDGGVMLAQLDLQEQQLNFYMLGDMQGSEPLHFQKQ